MAGAGAAAPVWAGTGTHQARQKMVLLLRAACPAQARQVLGDGYCPAQGPVLAELRADGARVVGKTQFVDAIVALLTPAEARSLASQPNISEVLPDSSVPVGPTPSWATSSAAIGQAPAKTSAKATTAASATASPTTFPGCGTKAAPTLGPEALTETHDTKSLAMGVTGTGVTVAVLSDGANPTNPDLLRNKKYGVAGQQVISRYLDFSGDGTHSPTGGAEAFGDVSTIAAQGNREYNISQYVNPGQAARLPKNGCWIKILGAAPGATLELLKVIPQQTGFSSAQLLAAVQYAVKSGAKVINESFGGQNFPDTSIDVVRDADEAAVAAGVTVVVSSGDAGITSTIGTPASDPGVISVGATTDFRSTAQADSGGFDNPAVGNGKWVNNNIAAFSSAGYTQSGNTVSLVAPGDGDWELCSTDVRTYTECSDVFAGRRIGVQIFGGTSEAAPLTAAAAADVIQAYARAHGGIDPAPALVKQILTSTATDINAPAAQQGAGLLNILGAVKLAEALPPPAPPATTTSTTTVPSPSTSTTTSSTTTTTSTPAATPVRVAARALAAAGRDRLAPATASPGGLVTASGAPTPPNGTLLVGPSQVNIVDGPHTATKTQLSFTNLGPNTKVVRLSTRTLTRKVYDTGTRSFVLNPVKPTTNTGTFPIWSGVTEIYQVEKFKVPAVKNGRLVFSADYQYTGQSSFLHVTLFQPDGTYADYTEPQGLADYAETEVANPPAGTWTAVFFTELNGATKNGSGTAGPIQWDASTWAYAPNGTVTPSRLTIGPGQTATATLSLTTPRQPGDIDESVVVHTPGGQTTVPVTVRTTVPLGANGGTFTGSLTGGNGRAGSQAQMNTFFFQVPPSKTDLDASVALSTDPNEGLVGYLVGPSGQTVAYTSNFTLGPSGNSFNPTAHSHLRAETTPFLQMYAVAPEAGQWAMVLEWANPVSGSELSERFNGAVRFNQVKVSPAGIPDSATASLSQGHAHTFEVTIHNTGLAPEGLFFDPRLDQPATITLTNQNSAVIARNFSLPLVSGTTFPFYFVPTNTTQLSATLTRLSGSTAVSFDLSYLPGDPDMAPGLGQPGTAATSTGTAATLSLTQPNVIGQGMWVVNPTELGPFGAARAPTDTASVIVTAVTQAFDKTVNTGTDDFWVKDFSFSHFRFLEPGQSAAVTVTVTPTAAVGTHISGTLYLDDFTLGALFTPFQTVAPDANEVAAIPYSYTVAAP